MFLYTLIFAIAVATATALGLRIGPAVYNSNLGGNVCLVNSLTALGALGYGAYHWNTTWIFVAVTQLAAMMCCYGAAETNSEKSARTAVLWCTCVPLALFTLFTLCVGLAG